MSMNLRTSALFGRIGWKPENSFGDGVATIGHGRFSWFMGIYLRVMQGLGWIFMMDIQRVVQAPAWCLFLLFGKKHRIHCTLKEPKEIKVWSWRFVSLVSFPADYILSTQTWFHFGESKVKGIRHIIRKQTFMEGNFCPNVFTFSENKTTVKQSLCFVFCITCELTIPWKPRFWWIFLEYSHGFSTSDSGGGNDWEQWLGTSQPIKNTGWKLKPATKHISLKCKRGKPEPFFLGSKPVWNQNTPKYLGHKPRVVR